MTTLFDQDLKKALVGDIADTVQQVADLKILESRKVITSISETLANARLHHIQGLWPDIREMMPVIPISGDVVKGDIAILVGLALLQHHKMVTQLTDDDLRETLDDLIAWVETQETMLRIAVQKKRNAGVVLDSETPNMLRLLPQWRESLDDLDEYVWEWERTSDHERVEQERRDTTKGDAANTFNQKPTASAYRFASLGALLMASPLAIAASFIFLPLIVSIAVCLTLAGGVVLAERLTKPTWKRTYAMVQEAHAAALASHLNTVDAHISNNSANAIAMIQYGADTEDYYKERVTFMLAQARDISTVYEQTKTPDSASTPSIVNTPTAAETDRTAVDHDDEPRLSTD